MFNDLAFSIVGNKKPKTKNSKTSNENTKLDWVPWKETFEKTKQFHVLQRLGFFERTLKKCRWIFYKVKLL
jgi:hypothetical protein